MQVRTQWLEQNFLLISCWGMLLCQSRRLERVHPYTSTSTLHEYFPSTIMGHLDNSRDNSRRDSSCSAPWDQRSHSSSRPKSPIYGRGITQNRTAQVCILTSSSSMAAHCWLFTSTRAYQRTLLNGFTIQEVDVCGVRSTGDAKPSDLALPFHPIYDRKAWFVGKTVKLDPFYTQIWDVTKEEELWNLSKPSLRLATLMLTTAGLSPW
jgi:hypothetical protein